MLLTVRLPLTLNVSLKVEEAFTNMPAVVEVGVKADPPNVDSHEPPAPVPQAFPDPAIRPFVSAWRHWLDPVILPRVRAPALLTLNLLAPLTWKFKKSPEKLAGFAAKNVPDAEPELNGLSESCKSPMVEEAFGEDDTLRTAPAPFWVKPST